MAKVFKVAMGDDAATAICKALGLEASAVQRVVLDLQAGEIAHVYVQMLAEEDRVGGLDWRGLLADVVSVEQAVSRPESTGPRVRRLDDEG